MMMNKLCLKSEPTVPCLLWYFKGTSQGIHNITIRIVGSFLIRRKSSNKLVYVSQDLVPDEYNSYPKKRLTNVVGTVKVLSPFHCTMWCSLTDGCLAVNVIGNHDITCELKTGLSDVNEIQNDSSSDLCVLGRNLFNLQREHSLQTDGQIVS